VPLVPDEDEEDPTEPRRERIPEEPQQFISGDDL